MWIIPITELITCTFSQRWLETFSSYSASFVLFTVNSSRRSSKTDVKSARFAETTCLREGITVTTVQNELCSRNVYLLLI